MASQDHLGLFDTPPNRREVRFAVAVVALLFVALLPILVLRDVGLRPIGSFVPAVDAILILSDLIVAAVLYAQAGVFRSRALTVLASGYVFGALMLVPHVLTFPGAFAPDGLLGAGTSTTSWTFMFRRLAFPIAVIAYVLLKRADLAAEFAIERRTSNAAFGVLAAIGLAAVFTMVAIRSDDFLPPLYLNRYEANNNLFWFNIGYIPLGILAMALLLRQRASLLDIWLLVALVGWLVHLILVLIVTGRLTIGFYYQAVVVLVSSLAVMLALIAESNRLYARLALSTEARRREREARLMAMDAVTAAISHEVGQPLTAVGLNASAGLSWLTRPRPDVDKAITALRAISDAGQRTFDVIKSIRAMFAKEPGRATEFNLNDLVLETVSLLDRELAANKVSLQLNLDEALPPIRADRVQMQRVLVNLFTNAIESLHPIRGRPRHVVVRSALADGKDVLLQVSDTGAGIAPEDIEHIFDAFFTTKATGTGLGLPLCRTIVEGHGGRLWASQGEPNGATFHMQLPRRGEAAISLEDAEQLLTNLESSLRLLRRSKSDEVTVVIAELEQIVGEVRGTMRRPSG